MSRDWRLYWQDVLTCCDKVVRYTHGMDRIAFESDERTYDAVVRNLELIGEAQRYPLFFCPSSFWPSGVKDGAEFVIPTMK